MQRFLMKRHFKPFFDIHGNFFVPFSHPTFGTFVILETITQSFQSVEPRMKLRTRLCLHQFSLTHLSLRAKSYKTDTKEVSNEASYKAPLTRKTKLRLVPMYYISSDTCIQQQQIVWEHLSYTFLEEEEKSIIQYWFVLCRTRYYENSSMCYGKKNDAFKKVFLAGDGLPRAKQFDVQ